MVVDVAVGVRVMLFPLVAHAHADANKHQKNYQVQHHNIQKAPIVDITCDFISRKEIEPNFLDHADDVDYLISLTSELHVGLLGKLVTF